MSGTQLDIPNIDASLAYYFDVGTFLWALLVIGAALFFFLGTFKALRALYREGRQLLASAVWFINLVVLIFGLLLLSRAFRNFSTFITALAIIGVAVAFGWSRAAKKKEGEGGKEDKTKEKR